MGCVWRNTTNSTTCMSAQVAEFQHALAWNTANPLEIFMGNDSGLWRSTDAIGETGPACSSTDSTHFQNLNGSLGSLAEVVGLSPFATSPYSLMAGLGVNGTAGVKSAAAVADWPQILSGYGGPVAIDPGNSINWYVNDEPGVAIYLCSQNAPCTPAAFGASPVVNDADVGGDGDAMPTPAPFLVDPVDSAQLLIGTCRVWRGPADGVGWSAGNAISPILDSGATTVPCNGDALIRSMAAMLLASGGEIIYVGMYGSANDGANLPGHVLSATLNPSSGAEPTWTDLTLNPVVNDIHTLNYYGLDISSVTIDTHDSTGNTVYVTVSGIKNPVQKVETVYRSTDGGATWTDITANLPSAPANSLVVDPQNANVVYVATDQGVYFTTQIASCGQSQSTCWSAFGSGLPGAPAVALSAVSGGGSGPSAGRCHLWARPLANSVVERGNCIDRRCPESRFAGLPKPGLRYLQQPAHRRPWKHRQHRPRAYLNFRHRRLQRDRQLRQSDGGRWRELLHSGHVYAAGHRPSQRRDDHLRQRLRRATHGRSQRNRRAGRCSQPHAVHRQLRPGGGWRHFRAAPGRQPPIAAHRPFPSAVSPSLRPS